MMNGTNDKLLLRRGLPCIAHAQSTRCRKHADTETCFRPANCQIEPSRWFKCLIWLFHWLNLMIFQVHENGVKWFWRLSCYVIRASERVKKIFWAHSSKKWLLRKKLIQASIAFSTPPSQLNHFSLTCSFVHLPKCKISSEQRSKNVNKRKKGSIKDGVQQLIFVWYLYDEITKLWIYVEPINLLIILNEGLIVCLFYRLICH